MIIEPFVGVVLVELPASNYGVIPMPSKSYDSITHGTVLAINPKDQDTWGHLVGRTVHYPTFKDDCKVKTDDKRNLQLIPIKDIYGSSYTETTN